MRRKTILFIIFLIVLIAIIIMFFMSGDKQNNNEETIYNIAYNPYNDVSNKKEFNNNNNTENNTANLEIINSASNKKVKETININGSNTINLEAIIEVSNVERVRNYKYNLEDITDDFRTKLFQTLFKDESSKAEYDVRNNVWELKKSDKIGDYYLYEVSYPKSGEAIAGEKSFLLEYRNVDLCPLDYNIYTSAPVNTFGISEEDATKLCEDLLKQIDSENEYQLDYIHYYGKTRGKPFYWIHYKKVIDGMVITSYNDISFYVDNNGIERIYGSLYDLEEENKDINIISLEKATQSLKDNKLLISFEGLDIDEQEITISKITFEYIVIKDLYENVSVVPSWRFYIGCNESERNYYGNRILAINATNGDLIQGTRGDTF